MRKSCRWLGCAALMYFAALDVTGSCSSSLEAGFKFPWRKDRSTATQKDAKLKPEESNDLLAKARAYERAGDFPNATRAYREYLDAGGEPKALKKTDENDKSVVESEKKSSLFKPRSKTREKGADNASGATSETRLTSKSQEHPTKKARDPEFERTLGLGDAGTAEDPWANQPVAEADAVSGKTAKHETSAEWAETPPASQGTTQADTGTPERSANSGHVATSNSKGRQADSASQDSLDNLLDMDSGKLDWGDESNPPEGDLPADAGSAAEVAHTDSAETDAAQNNTALTDAPWAEPTPPADVPSPQKTAAASLPLIDFNAKVDTEQAETPVITDEKVSDRPADDWANTPSETALTPDTVSAAEPSETPDSEGFAPPIIEEEQPVSSGKTLTKHPESSSADEGVSTSADANDSTTRSLAARCQGCEPWVYAQVVKLDSTDPDVRKEGLGRLADMGRKAHPAAPAVRVMLQDKDPSVQAHAAWAWWEIENEASASVDTLKTLLKHTDANVVELACYILGDIGAPADSTAESLVLLRDHSDGTTKIQAAEALIRISGVDDKSLKILITALKSKDGQIRWSAAIALGRCHEERTSDAVVTALAGALKDIDPEVRSAAALSLGGLGKDAAKALPELQRIASSDNAQVREAALAALACMKL